MQPSDSHLTILHELPRHHVFCMAKEPEKLHYKTIQRSFIYRACNSSRPIFKDVQAAFLSIFLPFRGSHYSKVLRGQGEARSGRGWQKFTLNFDEERFHSVYY